MANLYCISCRVTLTPGQVVCSQCGGVDLACVQCHQRPAGFSICPVCDVAVAGSRQSDVQIALSEIPAAVGLASRVSETYQAGRFGVCATVSIPPRDAAIMNELLQLAQLLHGMAGRLNQFQGMTDHTRQVIRDMRTLANLAQEEVEMRRGPH
jgi:hypothetical protein